MRIVEFALDGHGVWPDIRARALDDGMTAFFGPPGSGKSTVAGLIAHVLYGRAPRETGAVGSVATHCPEGELIVEKAGDRYRLRRYNDVAPPGRLTVSSLEGRAVDGHTVEKLLATGAPRVAAQLYLADFAAPDCLERLLSSDFARAFRASLGERVEAEPYSTRGHIRHLLNRRDELARELESRLAYGRQRSRDLEVRLDELEVLREERRAEERQLREQLRTLDSQLADVEGQLRYGQLETIIQQQQSATVPADLDTRLVEVDEQIERWRETLADLERRAAAVDARLAQLHPDDATNELPLADQRAYLGVVRRLVADLEGELARLARVDESRPCVCHEAHQRLRPIVETLTQQSALLDRSLTEQERIAQYLDLKGEAEHLARCQAELQEQLNHLLDRRQALVRTGRPTRRRATCDPRLLSSEVASPDYDGLAARHAELQQQRAAILERLGIVGRKLDELTQRYEILARDRAGLLSSASVEQIRAELAALDAQLQGQWSSPSHEPAADDSHRSLRASDYLAQLSSGELVQVRHSAKGGGIVVRRDGTHVPVEQLLPAERALTLLALSLSLVTAHSRRGVLLPLVLDEPFDELNSRQIAAVTAVLHDFARSGRQLLVFTHSTAAIERFQSLGVRVQGMHELRHASAVDFAEPAREPTPRPAAPQRNVFSTVVDVQRTESATPFFLHEDDPISSFPALGSETDSAFRAIGIHTVGDLIEANPTEVAEQLARDGVTPALVRLWQTHQVLMCFVPDVSLEDAQVLTGAGVSHLDDLLQSDETDLENRLQAYLRSPRGQRFREQGYRLGSRLIGWRRGARHHISRWQQSVRAARWRQFNATQGNRTPSEKKKQTTISKSSTPKKSGSRKHDTSGTGGLQLERSSLIERAPSIGPKTAERLAKIGIRTVDDLLFTEADEVARKLATRHITAETVIAWQQQAHLACNLPGLRARDAQILVGCGLTDVESIARLKPARLWSLVEAFAKSNEGERVLRGGAAPDADECATWIAWARQRRSLEAA